MSEPKRILITGCSSGFGRLVVPHLLDAGHTVLAGLRGGEARLAATLGPEAARYPGRLHAVDLHLDQPATFSRAKEAVDRHFGGALDVLVNNAGFGLFGTLEDTSPEELREQFEVNFFGPVLLTRGLLPALLSARGRVINVSSAAGLMTVPGYGFYCASKHALEAFSEGLHYELAPLGVQVALLEPGGFRTGFVKGGKRVAAGTANPDSLTAPQTRRLVRLLDGVDARLPTPEPVVRKMLGLIRKKKIPLRTAVGLDAHAAVFLGWLIPDRLRVAFLRWGFARFVRAGR